MKQAAEKLECSTKTIRRYIHLGKFPGCYKQDGRLYIPDVDIMSIWTPLDAVSNRVQGNTVEPYNERQDRVDMDTPGHVQDIRRSMLIIKWKWLGLYYKRAIYVEDKQRFRQVKLNALNLAISGSTLLEAAGRKLNGYFQQRKALMENKEP